MPDRNNRSNNSDQDGPTIEAVLAEAERKMGQSIEAMRRDISTLRTGAGHAGAHRRFVGRLLWLAHPAETDCFHFGSRRPRHHGAALGPPGPARHRAQPDPVRNGVQPVERRQRDHRAHPAAYPGTAPGDGPPAEAQGGGQQGCSPQRAARRGGLPAQNGNGTSRFPRMRTGGARIRCKRPPTSTSRLLTKLPPRRNLRLWKSRAGMSFAT